jgi:hypothetical protein
MFLPPVCHRREARGVAHCARRKVVMKAMVLAAGVLAAALGIGASRSDAADLDYGRAPLDRYGSAYEDPRYRDLYGRDPVPPRYSYEQRYYKVPSPVPTPPGYVYRDNDAYRPGYPEPRRYSYADPGDWRHHNGCVPREEIKRRLVEEGWRDFHDLELRNSIATVRARRPSGDLYDLRVDRCTGEVVNATLIQRGGYGPYADDSGRRYYQRPYY